MPINTTQGRKKNDLNIILIFGPPFPLGRGEVLLILMQIFTWRNAKERLERSGEMGVGFEANIVGSFRNIAARFQKIYGAF